MTLQTASQKHLMAQPPKWFIPRQQYITSYDVREKITRFWLAENDCILV